MALAFPSEGLFCWCGLFRQLGCCSVVVGWLMMALVVELDAFFDVDFTLSMALDSQSDTVRFDEVYDRTRKEQHEVNRRIHRHRCDDRLLFIWSFCLKAIRGIVDRRLLRVIGTLDTVDRTISHKVNRRIHRFDQCL